MILAVDISQALAGVEWSPVVSALAVVVTIVLWWMERRARRKEAAEERRQREALGRRQEEMDRERLDMLNRYHEGNLQLQERLTNLVIEQAELRLEVASPPDVAVVMGRVAQLDAELVDGNVGTLVIRNTGPGHARLLDVQTLGDPAALVGGQDIGDGYDLPPGTSLKMKVALSMATPSPLTVRLTWQDGTGVQSRDVRV